ncbi:hypothetical protein VTN00DRAFT_3302 [Thermoascus crustaceus]|uniref:uncharacterized protein n=1 Tax=Thermoascus crustaceus TaxID=5088 RepID=UPI00374429E4
MLEAAAGADSTVVVGCSKQMYGDATKRCDLSRLLQYLWVRREGSPSNTPQPTAEVGKLKSGKWETAEITKVYDLIYRAGYTDGTSPQRLLGLEDWYQARELIAQPIQRIEAGSSEPAKPKRSDYDSDADYDKANNQYKKDMKQYTTDKAKEAARVAYMVRVADMEAYRTKDGTLQSWLGKKVETTRLLTGINNPRDFAALDSKATLELHSDDPDFKDYFEKICKYYRSMDPEYFKAVNTGLRALEGCRCDIPQVDGLEKPKGGS